MSGNAAGGGAARWKREGSRQEAGGTAKPRISSLFPSQNLSCLCKASSNQRGSLGRQASVPHKEGCGCPPPTSGVSDTKSTLDLRIYPSSAISSARSSTQILTQGQLSGWLREQRCLWGLQLGLGVGRTSYLAESEMDRKLITGLNNCRSVSPMGCPAHSNCCSAGIGEEGAIGIRQRAQWLSQARLQGWWGHRMSRASLQSLPRVQCLQSPHTPPHIH